MTEDRPLTVLPGQPLTCRHAIEFLMAYVENELDPAVKSEFDRHLSICPSCVNYLDSYRRTVRLTRLLAKRDDGPAAGRLPEGLVNAILAARPKS